LAAAAAVATITAMEDEGMVANAARIGQDVLGPGLRELALRHPSIGEVRGLGVFWAIELVANPATREPLAPYGGSSAAMNAVIAACKSGGLLPFANFNRIHAVPACNVTDAEVAEGLRILDAALTVADGYVS
jgi:taurine--2-oxoglutarate transaminase